MRQAFAVALRCDPRTRGSVYRDAAHVDDATAAMPCNSRVTPPKLQSEFVGVNACAALTTKRRLALPQCRQGRSPCHVLTMTTLLVALELRPGFVMKTIAVGGIST